MGVLFHPLPSGHEALPTGRVQSMVLTARYPAESNFRPSSETSGRACVFALRPTVGRCSLRGSLTSVGMRLLRGGTHETRQLLRLAGTSGQAASRPFPDPH